MTNDASATLRNPGCWGDTRCCRNASYISNCCTRRVQHGDTFVLLLDARTLVGHVLSRCTCETRHALQGVRLNRCVHMSHKG